MLRIVLYLFTFSYGSEDWLDDDLVKKNVWNNIPCLFAAEYPVSILHLDSIQCQKPAHKKEKVVKSRIEVTLQIAQVEFIVEWIPW